MSDVFPSTCSNIYLARFFTKGPGPNSTFFYIYLSAAFWGVNCYAERLMQAVADWSTGTEQFDDTTVVVVDVAA